jgi:hypothetical protein
MANLDQSLLFITSVHDAQRREGLWLAQHPFVQAVRTGSARRDEIERLVRQILAVTRNHCEILGSLSSRVPAETVLNAKRDLDLLVQLGEALSIQGAAAGESEQDSAAGNVGAWMRKHLAVPDAPAVGLVSWALVEAMSPEVGDHFAYGLSIHFGLEEKHLQYFAVAIKSRSGSDGDAAKIIGGLPMEQWDSVREQTLILSRLIVRLYDSVGDMWSAW